MPERVTPAEELASQLGGTNILARVVAKLAERPGRWVTRETLVWWVYQDDPNGGPDGALNSIAATLWRRDGQRPLLEHGWRLESSFKLGLGHLGYRLVLADISANPGSPAPPAAPD